MASNQNMRQRFDDDVISWLKANICDEFHAENSGVMFFDEPQLPHTDVTRDYVLLYNLETGGSNSELCFWREKKRALRRERALAVERGPQLELIDRVQGPVDCWYILNARIIHSVENATGMRLNLQISFDTEIPEHFQPSK